MTNSSKLKTNYDDEIDIINEVHVLEPSECFILSDREGSDNYLKAVAILNTSFPDICKYDFSFPIDGPEFVFKAS